jgi:hypothetical protein
MRGISIGGLYGPAIEGLAAVDQAAIDRASEEVKMRRESSGVT